ncbi:DUF1054 domain-containing protein [Bacillaceae bacterium S4-13-58]
MSIQGFNKDDFSAFYIDGLDERMAAIQERIQPKFKVLGENLTNYLSEALNQEMYLHIAKHARRSVNPPKDTWLAIAHNKRGYKKHPHFQLGLFDDHLFIWLAFIYELPQKENIARAFLEHLEDVKKTIPSHYMISLDHTQKEAKPVSDFDLEKGLIRFRDVKKGEFLVGQHISSDDPLVQNGEKLDEIAKETYNTLLPLYRMSLTVE